MMGNAHGGLYLVDLETDNCQKIIDWTDQKIDWDGRGGERGLRGIAFYNDRIYLASSREIYIYNKEFQLEDIITNHYLKYNHEIKIEGENLYITSTGFDSIIVYDIKRKKFIESYCIRTRSGSKPESRFFGRRIKEVRNSLRIKQNLRLDLSVFNPASDEGPKEKDTIHLNNVFVKNGLLHFSGTVLENIYSIEDNSLKKITGLKFGTHNVQPYRSGFILNNTYAKPKQISYIDPQGELIKSFPVISYNLKNLTNTTLPDSHAVQSFARGLCHFNNFIIGGSSPATISVYDFENETVVKTIQLSNDIRNAIHGLEVWPY